MSILKFRRGISALLAFLMVFALTALAAPVFAASGLTGAQPRGSSAALVAISVNSTSHKTSYTLGDSLDVTGLTILAVYSDGSSKTVAVTASMVSGFSSAVVAARLPLTVTYGSHTATYSVSVSAPVQTPTVTPGVPDSLIYSLTAYPPYCRLTFETNGGRSLSDIVAVYGTSVDLSLYVPIRADWNFGGWYSDEARTKAVTSLVLNGNLKVYASWTKEIPAGAVASPAAPSVTSGTASKDASASAPAFTDVTSSDDFYDDVAYVFSKGLMQGVSSTEFAPHASITRGMIVTILYRLEGEPAAEGKCPFTDVASGSYYEHAIIWAASSGVVEGYGGALFGPDDAVTCEQLAVILYRYANFKGYDTTQGGMAVREYDDCESISDYAGSAVTWGVNSGVMLGKDNKLTPRDPAQRWYVARAMHKFAAEYCG